MGSDIIDEYINDFEMENLINFTNVKNKTMIHNDFIKKLENETITEVDSYDNNNNYMFYINHIDLLINSKNACIDLIEYKCLVANLEIFFNALKLNNCIFKHSSLPVSINNDNINTLKRKSDAYIKVAKFLKFSDVYMEKSIFNKINIELFAECCNKIFLYYYLIMEIRLFQYKSINTNFTLIKYSYEIKLLINNFYRMMLRELSIYYNNKDMIISIMKKLTNKFLEYGNTPFSNICINLLETLGVSHRNIKIYTKIKYTYLVNPDCIERAFVNVKEYGSCDDRDVYNKYSLSIYNKIFQTRKEIIKNIEINIHPKKEDYIIFNVLQLNTYLKNESFWPKD